MNKGICNTKKYKHPAQNKKPRKLDKLVIGVWLNIVDGFFAIFFNKWTGEFGVVDRYVAI